MGQSAISHIYEETEISDLLKEAVKDFRHARRDDQTLFRHTREGRLASRDSQRLQTYYRGQSEISPRYIKGDREFRNIRGDSCRHQIDETENADLLEGTVRDFRYSRGEHQKL